MKNNATRTTPASRRRSIALGFASAILGNDPSWRLNPEGLAEVAVDVTDRFTARLDARLAGPVTGAKATTRRRTA